MRPTGFEPAAFRVGEPRQPTKNRDFKPLFVGCAQIGNGIQRPAEPFQHRLRGLLHAWWSNGGQSGQVCLKKGCKSWGKVVSQLHEGDGCIQTFTVWYIDHRHHFVPQFVLSPRERNLQVYGFRLDSIAKPTYYPDLQPRRFFVMKGGFDRCLYRSNLCYPKCAKTKRKTWTWIVLET